MIMKAKKTNISFINGVPELVIQELLSHRAMYGYEIVQEIKRKSGGTLHFGEGCVYSILHKLEAHGLLLSRREIINGRSRIVYRLSARGKRQHSQCLKRWREIVSGVKAVVGT